MQHKEQNGWSERARHTSLRSLPAKHSVLNIMQTFREEKFPLCHRHFLGGRAEEGRCVCGLGGVGRVQLRKTAIGVEFP